VIEVPFAPFTIIQNSASITASTFLHFGADESLTDDHSLVFRLSVLFCRFLVVTGATFAHAFGSFSFEGGK
jgi:hypothetical protein